MSKEAVQKLTKYQELVRNKLESKELPAKQVNREESYRAFLRKELAQVTAKIEALKQK